MNITKPKPVKWHNFFGDEFALINGQGDTVYLVSISERDDDGNHPVQILCKRSLIKFVAQYTEGG